MLYKKIRFIYSFCIFYLIAVTSYIHPYYADDYHYSFIYGTDQKFKNFYDILISGKIMYFKWSGRVLSNFLQNFFSFLGKEVFALSNAIIFLLILYYTIRIINITLYGNKIEEKEKTLNLIVLFYFFWYFIPAFSEDFIWLVGSANYSWMLLFLAIYLYNFINIDNISNSFCLIIGVLAGLSNEGTVLYANFFSVLWLFYEFMKKKNIDKRRIAMWVSLFVGSCVSMLAPGNFQRMANESVVMFPKNSLIEKIIFLFKLKEFLYLSAILLLIMVLIIILKIKVKIPFIFIFSGILTSVLLIIIMPRNQERALLIPFYSLFLIILIVGQRLFFSLFEKRIYKIILILSFFLIVSVTKVMTFYSMQISKLEKQRENAIFYYKSANFKEAVFEHYGYIPEEVASKYRVNDYIWKNPRGIGNIYFAKYHNFDKVYAIQKDNELLILEFESGSNVDNIKINFKSENYDLDAYIDKSTIEEENKLYVEIPQNTYEINISGDNFKIKNVRILQSLKGEIYKKDENIRRILL